MQLTKVVGCRLSCRCCLCQYAAAATTFLLLLLQVSEAAITAASNFIVSPTASYTHYLSVLLLTLTTAVAVLTPAAAGVRGSDDSSQQLHCITCSVVDRRLPFVDQSCAAKVLQVSCGWSVALGSLLHQQQQQQHP
jgi:hypothetical protein